MFNRHAELEPMPPLSAYETESAKQAVDWFVGRFVPSYRLLAEYGAMPLLLTPELLNYLRNRFLRGRVPWLAEVDLLLSDLCRPVDYELYAMQPAVRAYLLGELKRTVGPEELARVARTLIHYVRHLARSHAFVDDHTLQAQQWAAMVYLDDQRPQVAWELAASFAAAADIAGAGAALPAGYVDRAELLRLTHLTDTLAPELAQHQELVDYAALIAELLARSTTRSPAAQRAFQADVEGVTLRVPEALVVEPAPSSETVASPEPDRPAAQGPAAPDRYLTVKLRLDLQEASLAVAIESEGRTATGDLRIDREEIETVRSGLAMVRTTEIMQRLSEGLFSGEVGEILQAARQQAKAEDRGVRMAVQSDYTGDMPWEMLYAGDYLALAERGSLVRYREMENAPAPRPRSGPLRILVLDANEGAPLTKMSTAPSMRGRLRREFEEAIAPLVEEGMVAVTYLNPGELTEARVAAQHDAPWQALHYIGTELRLDDNRGLEQYRGDDSLAGNEGLQRLLRGGQLDVAVLFEVTLQSMMLDEDIAEFMALWRLPAVVRLRTMLFDEAKPIFIRTFYGALANGAPLDDAMHAARRELRSADPKARDWAQPVLHVAGLGDWRLVEAETKAEAKAEVSEELWAALVSGELNRVMAAVAEIEGEAPDAPVRRAVQEALVPVLTDGSQPVAVRDGAGKALGRLGDPRLGVGLRADGLPAIDWLEIPAGAFLYQEGATRTLESFWLARYPVTYRQFQAFLDDPEGFRNPAWWAGLAASDNDKQESGKQRFDYWNHPRENVSWYEAVAFCRWLTARAAAQSDLLPPSAPGLQWQITLPTEEQWEKAARGADGRRYPWGDEYIEGYSNIDETVGDRKVGQHYLQTTSEVGMYPQGASPYGLLDMSGNVWEWCLNEYSKSERTQLSGDASRVLRGGSWANTVGNASALRRLNAHPDDRNDNLGFRVCAVPVPIAPHSGALGSDL